jgi:hypothetical protein
VRIPEKFQAPLYPNLSEGFVLDEDRALHRYLKEPALQVWDATGNPRKVGVWFGHPDREIREQRYPYMIISLIDITEASNRTMSGVRTWENASVPLWALPESAFVGEDGQVYNGAGLWNDIWYDKSSYPLKMFAEKPIPVQIDYTVRAYSRHPRHDREIIGQFLSRKLNYRYSWLPMADIDGTNRRMELLNVGHSETMEMGKRLFMSVFTVRVDSFMPAGDVLVVEGADVLRVLGTLFMRERDPEYGPTVIKGGWINERPEEIDPYEGV